MQYVLGNMLNGGGGLNADGLALDLQFAADKTLTARKGPTPVFTRASTATFVGSNGLIQSAGNNVARFDHDPITLACKGLLIEESRTNSITGSNAFNTWTMANATVATSSVTTPEGTADAWKVVEDILLANHILSRSFTPVSGTTYTASMWLKSAENGFAFVGLSGGGFASTFVSVDLSTGAVTTATGTPIGATSVSYPNGWWRVSFSLAATASSSSTVSTRLSRDGDWANRSYLGNGVNGMYCYGGQVEAGSFATSYIPTTTASVVRSADVCSITGGGFTSFYNQSEGTMLTNAFTPASGDRTVLSADDNTANEMIRLRTEGTNPFFKVTDGGSELVAIDAGTVSANTSFKLIGAYKLDDFASSINGGAAVTDTSGTTPTVDRMRIGAGQGGNTMCGCVASLRYYKKRLPNAKLQALTA
jgi:hypothetical protein